jgi:2-methylcitrate dehydratase PrpD
MAEPNEPSHNCATGRLAEFVSTTTFADLPPSVVTEVERAVLDWLGSELAGSLEPPARAAQQAAHSLGQSSEATVFGAGRSSAAGAAFANGVAAHILEFDDLHGGSTVHAAAAIIPAALAIAEREHAGGEAFLLAVALGYEIALRIGEAVNPSHYRFWHPTGTVTTFGAAAAAGSLLGLTQRQMQHALGSAGTQAAGLWEFNADGAMSKHLHPGKAAFNGILAADLARYGFTGASRILEGDRGFFAAMSDGCNLETVTAKLGGNWKISENCYKLYACCGHTHTAIDAAIALREKLGWRSSEASEFVAGIDITTYRQGFEIVKDMNPKTPFRAKFSLAYVTAAALQEGRIGLEQFDGTRFNDAGVVQPDIAALLPRVHIKVSEELTAQYPKAWPAVVSVTLKDGSVLKSEGRHPRGSPENPVSSLHLKNKFRALVEPRWGQSLAEKSLQAVERLRFARDVAGVFDYLGRSDI